MATESELEYYLRMKALGADLIKLLGGDPDHPTQDEAMAVARFFIDMAVAHGAPTDVTAKEVMDWHDEFERDIQ